VSIPNDFSRAAASYDDHATLQQAVQQRLARIMPPAAESAILDAGCGTGTLAKLWPHAEIIGLDIAEGMCRMAQQKQMPAIVADMTALPLDENTMQGVFSSLALQWVAQPQVFLQEAKRVTQPSGYLWLATLGQKTLQELAQAYHSMNLQPPLLPFFGYDELCVMLAESGWQVMAQASELRHTEHPSLKHLMQHLKQLGTRHKTTRHPLTRAKLYALEKAYPTQQEMLKASWEVWYFVAQKINR
jgi:malonyl-CoA O-methyltransferase